MKERLTLGDVILQNEEKVYATYEHKNGNLVLVEHTRHLTKRIKRNNYSIYTLPSGASYDSIFWNEITHKRMVFTSASKIWTAAILSLQGGTKIIQTEHKWV